MTLSSDYLYQLLPAVYRYLDEQRGSPLRALLGVITEQVAAVDADIAQLYDNWFIETCQEWVVPYLGDLIGYQPVHEAGDPGAVTTPQGVLRNKILIPRRDVANTLRYRRRKGTLLLLEDLAQVVAGWPAHAVEFYKLLGLAQPVEKPRLSQGRLVDLRHSDELDRLNGPFDDLAHRPDVRGIASHWSRGHYNLPNVGLFVWRLKTYSVTRSPAYCVEEGGRPGCYTFSVLGNNTPLFTNPRPVDQPGVPVELQLPIPIRRRAFEKRTVKQGKVHSQASPDYYGTGKSLAIWADHWHRHEPEKLIPAEGIIPADLSGWHYVPARDHVAVDPELGRIAFSPDQVPRRVTVTYHYGFSADLGGGEYERPVLQPQGATLEKVRGQRKFREALERWKRDQPPDHIIEITDSGEYVPPPELIELTMTKSNQRLQIRAASGQRPVIRLLDYKASGRDTLTLRGQSGCRFILDGLLITGRGVSIERDPENKDPKQGNPEEVVLRHCTLVPRWTLTSHCQPRLPQEPSLEVFTTGTRITIEHSILGTIEVNHDELPRDPFFIRLSDSILDATRTDLPALEAPGCAVANARLTVLRSTVLGAVKVHAIDLAENSIFDGLVMVARRQQGCMRFCYVLPRSDKDSSLTARTPRRYECQPDLVDRAADEAVEREPVSGETPQQIQERKRRLRANEELRVRPQFQSTDYGTPSYCQLAETCAPEIRRGADDEAEMGAFHDLFQPQRDANLHARLEEFTPAAMEVGVIYAS